MLEEVIYEDGQELQSVQLNEIVNAACNIYQTNSNKPVRILDLATGPNGFNPTVIRALIHKGINYRLVLSDISPRHFKIGYENIEKELSIKELQKVKCVLADSRDFRGNLINIPLHGKWEPLKDILADEEYQFLQKGYQNGERTVDFSDCSFDLVIGCIPYGSINPDYPSAIEESARVLSAGGYHIVNEMHVEKINANIERTESALKRANIKLIDKVRSKLDEMLKPVAVFSSIYEYKTQERIPEQTMQYGDIVKMSVLVHQKR
jgi:SAM-dependent methyltransferase